MLLQASTRRARKPPFAKCVVSKEHCWMCVQTKGEKGEKGLSLNRTFTPDAQDLVDKGCSCPGGQGTRGLKGEAGESVCSLAFIQSQLSHPYTHHLICRIAFALILFTSFSCFQQGSYISTNKQISQDFSLGFLGQKAAMQPPAMCLGRHRPANNKAFCKL